MRQIEDLVSDNEVLLQYRCQICEVETDLYGTARHVLSRQHRQRYLVRLKIDHDHESYQVKHFGVVFACVFKAAF